MTAVLAGLMLLGLFVAARADAPTSRAHEDFGQYLVDHQSDLAPFFQKNGAYFFSHGVPVALAWTGQLMLATLIIGWVLDALLGRGFSSLFAPALSRLSRALVYATGRLVLSVVSVVLFGLVLTFGLGLGHVVTTVSMLGIVFALFAAAAQTAWIRFLYRTDIFISFFFYLTLVVIHGFVALGISAPMLGTPASGSARTYVDGVITPKLDEEIASTKQTLAGMKPARDASAAEAGKLQDRIDQDKTDLEQVRQQIDAQRNSPGYLFSQIVKVHARGDLATAQAELADFVAKFPDSALSGLAQGQLTQVKSELAEQQEQKQLADAATMRDAAAARADLLARAARGEVTLSQMRSALIGKTPPEVSALLGTPTITASDRWGYAQKMMLNPMSGEKFGLAVYFSDGLVQGVDYYYGTGAATP